LCHEETIETPFLKRAGFCVSWGIFILMPHRKKEGIIMIQNRFSGKLLPATVWYEEPAKSNGIDIRQVIVSRCPVNPGLK